MYSPTKKRSSTVSVIFTLRGIQRRLGLPVAGAGGPSPGVASASIAFMLSRLRGAKAVMLGPMADEHPDTWRSRLGATAGRRGIPLGTIVVATAVAIGLIDLNAALIVGLWVLRKIVLYIVIAGFLTMLFTPPMRYLTKHGLSHGVAATFVFLGGLVVIAGLIYLFASPLVTSAIHFGHQI